MTSAIRAICNEQWEKTRTLQRMPGQIIPLVFHNKGRRIVNNDKAWHRACQAAGIPGRIVHDFSRTAVRNMVRAGIPERVAMQMAGHRTRSVFDSYHIVSDADLQDAARRLEVAVPSKAITKTMTIADPCPVDSVVRAGNR